MVVPNFFCIGAQKAGTTTLHDILSKHPDIYLPESKEAFFFHYDENYIKGLKWYEKTFFDKWNGQNAVGSITPEYLYYENAAARIHKDLGSNIKLILILRNPVARAYSHYLMTVSRGFENESFEKAIQLEEERLKKGNFEKLHFSYLSRGHYFVQISRFLDLFPYEQMKFIIFEEEIKKNINQTIGEILDFLDVENIKLECHLKSNPASIPRSNLLRDFIYRKNIIKKFGKYLIPKKVGINLLVRLDSFNRKPFVPEKLTFDKQQSIFSKYFFDDIEKLEGLIHRDLSIWTPGNS